MFIAVIVWALYTVAILLFANRPTDAAQDHQPELEVITIYEEVLVHVPPENTAYYKDIALTDDEWLLLGQKIYAEAGNQTDLGKRAVVEVVLNRCLDPRFPDTVTEVLLAPGQFTSSNWVDEETAKAQYPIIEAVLREEDPILRSDVVYFATYKANGTFYEQIGSHYFCY